MGKPKHSDDSRGEQKGAQAHAEGQHGPKAYEARKAQISNKHDDASDGAQLGPRAANDPRHQTNQSEAAQHERTMHDPSARDGRHELVENRLQHDEAEKNSEKNRLIIDAERHGHDPEGLQIPGGRETHPALPQDGPERTIRVTGQGGGNRSKEDRAGH
ncbi:MAG TPA: hypothetical protein VEZ47_05275 [Gemmatirosa sp.]|jgi:hypothetical protein|nr:hypothetical protein [Gemmatirosa sp.]